MPDSGSKKETAYFAIKRLLDTGGITSGDVYSEKSLAEIINVSQDLRLSRTPVREALQAIAREGLVKIIPKKGVLVTTGVTLQEVADMFDLRSAVETFALRKAFPWLTKTDIARMRGFIEEQKKHVRDNDPNAFVLCDFEMHMHIMTVYHNEWILDIIRNLRERFFSVGLRAIVTSGRACEELLAEHIAYVDALEERDFAKAHACLLKHFDRGIETFERQTAGPARRVAGVLDAAAPL